MNRLSVRLLLPIALCLSCVACSASTEESTDSNKTASPTSNSTAVDNTTTTTTKQANEPHNGNEPTDETAGLVTQEMIETFAEDLNRRELSSSAVAPGSPAEAFLSFRGRSIRLVQGKEPTEELPKPARTVEVMQDAFFLRWSANSQTRFDRFKGGPDGIEDFMIDGRQLSSQITTMTDFSSTPGGVQVTNGVSYLTETDQRLAIISIVNESDHDLSIDSRLASFVSTKASSDVSVSVSEGASTLAARTQADLLMRSRNAQGETDGVAKVVFHSSKMNSEFQVEVTFG